VIRALVPCFGLLVFLFGDFAAAQDLPMANYGSFSVAFGESQSSYALDVSHVWSVGASRKFALGVGARLTAYFGSNKYYTSAPASLASSPANTDSIFLQSPQVNSFNVTLNFAYSFSSKLGLAFNIDAIGSSFGSTLTGSYIGPSGGLVRASPTAFNLLLINNNDMGSLNSEFSVRYFVSEHLAVKLLYQHLFTEYTTYSEVQLVPEPNDRFRFKGNLFGVGVCQRF
jgi:hypothetical protein